MPNKILIHVIENQLREAWQQYETNSRLADEHETEYERGRADAYREFADALTAILQIAQHDPQP